VQKNTSPPAVTLRAGEYIADLAREMGLARASPLGGLKQLDWNEIAAFSWAMSLEPREARILMDMSRGYLRGINAGTNVFSKPPTEWET
jgi:hypothetical protein